MRQFVSTQLLSALSGRNVDEQSRAKRGFIEHGYFNDAISQLRRADSPAERAAAARKLGAVGDAGAIAHLVAALDDTAPEVRRASAESLGQIGDPSAIAPLNELLLRETSPQVPQAVIRHAINSIGVLGKKHAVSAPRPAQPTSRVTEPSLPKAEEPESAAKREIFADYLNSFEQQTRMAGYAPPSNVPSAAGSSSIAAAEEQLRMEVEIRLRAEEEARKRMLEEVTRQKAEEEVRIRMEIETRQRAEEHPLLRSGEEPRFSAEVLRKASEELALKRAEAEAARKLVEEQELMRAAEEARVRAEEEEALRARSDRRRDSPAIEAEAGRQAEEAAVLLGNLA